MAVDAVRGRGGVAAWAADRPEEAVVQAAADEAFQDLGGDWEELPEELAGRADQVRPPIPQFEDQLIDPLPPLGWRAPPQREDVPLGAPPPPEEDPAPARGRAPAVAAAPAPLPQATPQPPRPQADPGLLERICQVFVEAIAWIVEMVKTYIFCMARATAVPPQQPAQAAAPAIVQPAAEAAPQPIRQAPAVPAEAIPAGRVVGTLNLHPVDGEVFADYCSREFLNEFWGQPIEEMAPAPIQALIDRSLREGVAKMVAQMEANDEAFPNLEEIPLALPDAANGPEYLRILNVLDLHAIRNHWRRSAVILEKGDQSHVLLVDARDRANIQYRHYNPHGVPSAYLQNVGTAQALADHLNAALPIVADERFAARAYRVREAAV